MDSGSNGMVGNGGMSMMGLIKGDPPARIVMDPRPCPMPPNFAKTGYKPTFFANQKHYFKKGGDQGMQEGEKSRL